MTDNKREVATTSDNDCSPGASFDVPASSPPGDASEAAPVVRDEKGRFVKGSSGNPRGMLPGTKQRITRHKEELEASFRAYVNGDNARRTRLFRSIDKLLNIVEHGEDKDAVAAFRAFSKHFLSELKPEDPAANTGPRDVVVEIHNHTGGHRPAVDVVIDNVDYEDVTNG